MTDCIITAVIDGDPGQIRVRVYRNGELVVDAPLSWRRAVVLASDMLAAAMVSGRAVSAAQIPRIVTPT